MDNNLAYNKAWLQVFHQGVVTYKPVIIMARTSQTRSFVADLKFQEAQFLQGHTAQGHKTNKKNHNDLNNGAGYFVEHSNLMPRSGLNSMQDLMRMQYPNIPELKHIIRNSRSKLKFIRVGNNLLLDLTAPTSLSSLQSSSLSSTSNAASLNCQLINFYKIHILSFALDKNQTKMQMLLLPSHQNQGSKQTKNNYLTLLLETLAAQQQLWPHTLHIANLAMIIQMLMPELCIKMELGFGTFDFKNSNRIFFVRVLPFNHALFTCSEYTMECLMKISSSTKFTQMYKGPPNSQNPVTELSHCQKLAQSLLSLSFQVPQIHSIMRTISLLCNLNSLKKSQSKSQANTILINNIEDLLRIQKGRLEDLLKRGQNQSIFLQGTLEENVLYRTNRIIDAVYQGFVIGLCRKIGQKMIVEGRNQHIVDQQHNKDKLLTVILDNTYANMKENRQLQAKNTYYQEIRRTHQQILKKSIHRSPILQSKSKFSSSLSSSPPTSNIYIKHLQQKKQHFLSLSLSEAPQKNKQIQFIDQQILQFDYHQQILNSPFMFQVFIGMFQGHYQTKDRAKEAMLILKELGQVGRLAVVAGVAVLDQHGLAEVVEAIRIRKKEIGSDLFKYEREGISQMTLFEFCNRYFYTKYCKSQPNPQMSPQLKKSRLLPKCQLLTLSSPYLDHETAVLQCLPRLKQKIGKQSPEDINIEMQNKYKLQDCNIRIRSIEFMEKMEKEVDRIKAKVEKIESQVLVYLRRKKTFHILKLIWRETKMEKLLDKIFTNNTIKLSGFAMSMIKAISIQKRREQQQKEEERRRQQQRIRQKQKEREQQKRREKQQQQRIIREEQRTREQELQRLKKQQEQQQLQKIRREKQKEQRIMDQQAEEEREIQRIKEKFAQYQKQKENQMQNQNQNQKSISIDKQILLQRQMELITQRERKMVEEQIKRQQQIQRQRAIEQQKQRQRQREIQRRRERQLEIQRQKERERQRQRQEQMERQKRQQLERQEKQRELQQIEQRKRKQAQEVQMEQRAKRQQEQREKQAEIDRKKSQLKKYERYEQVSDSEKSKPKTKMKKQMSIKSIEPSNGPSSKNTPMSAYKVQVREVNTPDNESMQQQPRTQQFQSNKLSATGSDFKRSQIQYISKSENLEQLAKQQLASLQDNPQFNYEYWFQNSKQIFEIDFSRKQIFNPYIDPTPGKPELDQRLHPDKQILDLLQDSHYIAYTKQITDHQTGQDYVRLMMHQPKLIQKPIIKFYNIYSFPTFFKDSFNAILKIGQDKNTTKPLHQLFNVFFVPLIQTYYKEIKEQNSLFHEQQMIAHDYHSVYNRLVDEVFLQFMKQITPAYPQTFPKKNMHAYLFGLSVFTRYFHPSPNFIYPLTYYVYFIYKQSQKENIDPVQTELLQSVFENLLFFIQATQGFKRNPVKGFLRRKKTQAAGKSQTQCAGYLHPRTTPISQAQINKPQPFKKPQPPALTIWLTNNWSLTYFIRNQIAKSLKKRMLSQLGVLAYERAYSLAYMESDNTLTPIDDKQKVSVLFQECQKVEKKFQKRIYLRMDYYVAFQLGEVGTMRLTYLNMILDQPTYPWVSIKYEFLMFMATLFKQFVEKRAQNYVKFARQWKIKTCSTEELVAKFPKFLTTLPQKHPQVEYFRFMVSTGFGVAKCFKKINDPAYSLIVKPLQIAIYNKQQKKVSISFKRIRNAYIEDKDKRIVIELYLRDEQDKKQEKRGRLKTWTIQDMQNMKQLFKCILFYLENQKPTTTK